MHNPDYNPEQQPPGYDPRFPYPGSMPGQPSQGYDPRFQHPGAMQGHPQPGYDPRFQHPGAMQGHPPGYPPGGMPGRPPGPQPPSSPFRNKKLLMIGGGVVALLVIVIVMMSSCGGNDEPASNSTNAEPTPVAEPASGEVEEVEDQRVIRLAQEMFREQWTQFLQSNPTPTPVYFDGDRPPYTTENFLDDYINCIYQDAPEEPGNRDSIKTALLLDIRSTATDFIDAQCPREDRVSAFILNLLHPPDVPGQNGGAAEEPPADAAPTEEPNAAP